VSVFLAWYIGNFNPPSDPYKGLFNNYSQNYKVYL
jgi:hypothetical protein